MSLSNDFETYKKEIELIQAQNPVECELYSIIACIMRERKNSTDISLRDVSVRRKSELSKIFMSKRGFPDFVILKKKFNMYKPNKKDILGAIEAKRVIHSLESPKQLPEQLKEHISYFNKVIYTNGLEWQFYTSDEYEKYMWTIKLGKIDKEKIDWETNEKWLELLDKLDNIAWEEKI